MKLSGRRETIVHGASKDHLLELGEILQRGVMGSGMMLVVGYYCGTMKQVLQ